MQFRILGPLEVVDGDSVISLAGAKQRGLLAILLLNANETVSADRLIDELWTGRAPESGRTALQVRVSQLRRALGPGGTSIQTRAPGYVLRLVPDQLDLHRFERLVAEAESAVPAVAAAKLSEALALWRGSPLLDLAYESFAQPAIRRLSELRLAALEKRIDADLAVGRHGVLVGELWGLVEEHPLRERFRGQLMLALYRCDRQADGLAVYQDARRAFIDELGIEPGPSLRALEQAILRQEPSLDLAPAPSQARSVLAVAFNGSAFGPLLALGVPLARQPGRELVLVRLIEDPRELQAESAAVEERRQRLLAAGLAARAAVFTSTGPGVDVLRIVAELDCDLMLVEASPEPLDSPALRAILTEATCDVGALAGGEPKPGPLLVPFVGAEHDWSAIEVGAWLAGSWGVPLRIAGPSRQGGDASHLLASASLAIQRVHGVAAEPLLLSPGPDELVHAAEQSALAIVGLPDRWQKDGLGQTREALVRMANTPALLVRRGLRPGGLAPNQSRTRFTWSLTSA